MKNELKALTMERRLRAERLHRKAQQNDVPEENSGPPAVPTAALKAARTGARKAAIALAPATTTA